MRLIHSEEIAWRSNSLKHRTQDIRRRHGIENTLALRTLFPNSSSRMYAHLARLWLASLLSFSKISPHIEAKGGILPHGVSFDCIGCVSVAVSDTVPDAVSAGVIMRVPRAASWNITNDPLIDAPYGVYEGRYISRMSVQTKVLEADLCKSYST